MVALIVAVGLAHGAGLCEFVDVCRDGGRGRREGAWLMAMVGGDGRQRVGAQSVWGMCAVWCRRDVAVWDGGGLDGGSSR